MESDTVRTIGDSTIQLLNVTTWIFTHVEDS